MKTLKNLLIRVFIISVVMIILSHIGQPALAEDTTFEVGGVNYVISSYGNFEVRIGDHQNVAIDTSTTGILTIPDSVEYNGQAYKVTEITTNAFKGCSELEGVVISDNVVRIGASAFEGCSKIKSMEIPDSVEYIEASAFEGCSKIKSMKIPDGVKTIGNSMFKECSELETIVIPDSVESIGVYAFENSGLTELTLGAGLKRIESYAFFGCSELERIDLSDNLNHIGVSAFENCESLETLDIPDGVTEIGSHTFSGCSGLKSIYLPEKLTSIGNFAFNGCSGLTSIEIPEGIEEINDSTFSNCSELIDVNIPNSVTEILPYAFADCSKLTTINIPNGVTEIGTGAFQGCSGLTDLNIASSVTKIGQVAFESCVGLTTVIIPENLTSIARSTFARCIQLTEINIPKGVKEISYNAFQNCSMLTMFSVDEENKHFKSLDGVLFDITGQRLLKYPEGNTRESYTIPEDVTKIDPSGFLGSNNIQTMYIHGNITDIGLNAFSSSGRLETIYLTSIPVEDAVDLTVHLPNTVKNYYVTDSRNLSAWREVVPIAKKIPRSIYVSKPKLEDNVDELVESESSGTITEDLGINSTVSKEILGAIVGSDITLELTVDDFVWTINGKGLKDSEEMDDVDLGVEKGTNNIPEAAKNEVPEGEEVIEFTLDHKVINEIDATLKGYFGKDNSGKYANLYYYDESEAKGQQMKFIESSLIDDEGFAELQLVDSLNYLVVITDEPIIQVNFEDVKETDWFYEYVKGVVERGLMTGMSESEFDPNGSTTRAMMWTVLARMDGVETEVPEGEMWYSVAQNWAIENEISDGTDPDGLITREQFVTMLFRFDAPEAVTMQTMLGQFEDSSNISEYAVYAMEWAVSEGIISGKTENTLDPQGNATRAEIATMLQRFMSLDA